MKDSEHQDGQTVAFPVSDLTRRLLRRATEPIGVIDVRHATELHSRSGLWLGQRLELLDNLKSRYRLDQGAGGTAGAAAVAGGMYFISPLQRMAATSPFDLASVSRWVSRTGMPETATGTVSQLSPASSAQQYRVKRPNSHAEPNPSKAFSSETVSSQSPVRGGIQVSANSAPAMLLQRKTSEMQSPISSRPDPSAMPLVHAAGVETPERVDNRLAPRHDSSPTIDPLAQVCELPRTAIVAQMHLQRMPGASAAGEKIGSLSTREDLPGDEAPILGSSPSSGLHLQRKPNDPATFPAANSAQTAETVTALPPTLPPARSNSRSQGAVSAEIRVAPSLPGSTSIVWRRADTNGASRESATPGPALAAGPAYAIGPQIMREAVSEPVSSGSVAPIATATAGSNGADVMRVAEQVSRIIARQLRVERERRGRTR